MSLLLCLVIFFIRRRKDLAREVLAKIKQLEATTNNYAYTSNNNYTIYILTILYYTNNDNYTMMIIMIIRTILEDSASATIIPLLLTVTILRLLLPLLILILILIIIQTILINTMIASRGRRERDDSNSSNNTL